MIGDELGSAGIEERHVHLIAKGDVRLDRVAEDMLVRRIEIAPAVIHGVAIGGSVGSLAGIIALALPENGIVLGGGAILGSGLARDGLDRLVTEMIGVDQAQSRAGNWQDAIEQGELLMMVDADESRAGEIDSLVGLHHPSIVINSAEPRLPRFL
jgi:hypothetical protein